MLAHAVQQRIPLHAQTLSQPVPPADDPIRRFESLEGMISLDILKTTDWHIHTRSSRKGRFLQPYQDRTPVVTVNEVLPRRRIPRDSIECPVIVS